jgi:superfamily I DNA and/or RNA helicase
VEQAIYYVQKLRETPGIALEDIGIIAPYQKQVAKMQKGLDTADLGQVTVGSCEQFQGQERQVIIISTVRSPQDLMGHGARFNLGFVSNPKRLNVVVTRAQALLIVIGSVDVLWTDPNWRRLIQHCIDHGAYPGRAPSDADTGDGVVAAGEADAEVEAMLRLRLSPEHEHEE